MNTLLDIKIDEFLKNIDLNDEFEETQKIKEIKMAKVKVFYSTDPICSYCWQAEPILRKFDLLYGDSIEFKTLMGGLLPSWENFSDPANGINKASDVTKHWIEAGEQYGMPIVGTVWESNPLSSSFPPSIIFKMIQKISDSSSKKFLRLAREELFAFNRNISDDIVLEDMLNRIDRNGKKIVEDSKNTESRGLLKEDFLQNMQLGVSGFPTLVFQNDLGETETLVGYQPFSAYEAALNKISHGEIKKKELPNVKELFSFSRNLFEKEIMEIYDLKKEDVIPFLEKELGSDGFEKRDLLFSYFVILNPAK